MFTSLQFWVVSKNIHLLNSLIPVGQMLKAQNGYGNDVKWAWNKFHLC